MATETFNRYTTVSIAEWKQMQAELKRLTAQLAAARAIIREFVYPGAVMTPAQREAWDRWQELSR